MYYNFLHCLYYLLNYSLCKLYISGIGEGSGPVTLPAQMQQPSVIQEGGARSMDATSTAQRPDQPYATMPPMRHEGGGARSMEAAGGSMDVNTGNRAHSPLREEEVMQVFT